MQINQFPHQYESERKNKANNDIYAERNRCSSRQKSIRDGISGSADTGAWAGVCGFIGFIIGFFVCCTMCMDGDEDAAFATWLVLSGGGAALGAILAGMINAGHNSSEKNANNEIANESSRSERAIQEINAQADQDIANYRAEFESEAQRMSVRYAESALATEVINWMTDGFSRTIDATDRRSHIEKINVPEGMIAEIINTNLTVRVRGPEEEISRLTEKDISAVVDFSAAEAGTATYKAVIQISEEFPNVGAMKTSSVSATVLPVEG